MFIGLLDNNLSYTNIGVVKTAMQSIVSTHEYESTDVGKKLTQMSTDLTINVLREPSFFKQQKVVPVLVIFEPLELEKITDNLVNSIALDTVYFSSVDYDIDKYWVLGSLQSIVKILRPAYKILDLKSFKSESDHITDNSAKYFQLVWFAHRIGLKVYEP